MQLVESSAAYSSGYEYYACQIGGFSSLVYFQSLIVGFGVALAYGYIMCLKLDSLSF